MHVVEVSLHLRTVALELRMGLREDAVGSAREPPSHLGDPIAQLRRAEVLLLEQDASYGQQPTAVIRQTEIDGATYIDVSDAATLLGQPHAPPCKYLADDVGHVLPVLVLFVLVLHGGIGLAADVVHRLHVRRKSSVIDQIRCRRIREFRVRRLQAGDEFELFRTFSRIGHGDTFAFRCTGTVDTRSGSHTGRIPAGGIGDLGTSECCS